MAEIFFSRCIAKVTAQAKYGGSRIFGTFEKVNCNGQEGKCYWSEELSAKNIMCFVNLALFTRDTH